MGGKPPIFACISRNVNFCGEFILNKSEIFTVQTLSQVNTLLNE